LVLYHRFFYFGISSKDTFTFRLFPEYTYTKAQRRRFRLFQGRIEHWRKAINYADSFDSPNQINLLYLIGYPEKIRPYVEKTKSNLVVLCAEAPPAFLKAYDAYWELVERYKGTGYVSQDGAFSEAYTAYRALENAHRGDGILPDEIYERNDQEAAILSAYAKACEDATEIFSRYHVIGKFLPEKSISHTELDWIIRKIFPHGREQTGMNEKVYTSIKLIQDALKAGLERRDAAKLLKLPDGTDCYTACQKNIRRCEMNLNTALRATGQVDLVETMERMKAPPYGWDDDPYAAYCFGYAVSSHLAGTWLWDEVSCFPSAEAAEAVLRNILRGSLIHRKSFVLIQELGYALSERFAYLFDMGTEQYQPKDEIDKEILALFLEGLSERKIAEKLGTMSNIAVHKRLVRMGKTARGEIPFCNLSHIICKKIEGITQWPVSLVDERLTAALRGTFEAETYRSVPIFGRQKVREALTYFTWEKCKVLKRNLGQINESAPELIRQKYGTGVDIEQIKASCTTQSSGWLWTVETFWECVDRYIKTARQRISTK